MLNQDQPTNPVEKSTENQTPSIPENQPFPTKIVVLAACGLLLLVLLIFLA